MFCGGMRIVLHVEDEGQSEEFSSLLPPCGSRDQTQFIQLGSQCLYLLSHLTAPL